MRDIEFVSDTRSKRIDSWLSKKIDSYSRSYIQKLISENLVSVNGSKIKSNYKLKRGDYIKVSIPDSQKLDIAAEKISLDIVYEDNDIIVVNKPKGMVVHPATGNYSGTLVNALMYYCGNSLSDINGIIRPGIVHRIDKDTSGLLVVAKNNSAHKNLSDMFKMHNIERKYVAVVHGVIKENSAKIDAPIGRHPVNRKKMAVNTKHGRHAITYFKVLKKYNQYTCVQLKLETGRTHQIRVHLSYIGYPVAGDKVYGAKKDKLNLKSQVLHAKTLGFSHPVTNKYMKFESDLPEYFNKLLDYFEKEHL